MIIQELRDMINNGKIEEALSLIEQIGSTKNNEAVPVLMDILKTTNDGGVRNQVALALSDIGDPSAVEPIIELIKSPKTLGNRGTLLYALQPFDCSSYIELLVELLCKGGWEVRGESVNLLEKITSEIPSETLLNCIQIVHREIDELDNRYEHVTKAQDLLINMKHK